MININHLERNFTKVQIGEIGIFFSYTTPVAVFSQGKWYRTKQHFSKTTSKHLNRHIPASAELVDQADLEKIIIPISMNLLNSYQENE